MLCSPEQVVSTFGCNGIHKGLDCHPLSPLPPKAQILEMIWILRLRLLDFSFGTEAPLLSWETEMQGHTATISPTLGTLREHSMDIPIAFNQKD